MMHMSPRIVRGVVTSPLNQKHRSQAGKKLQHNMETICSIFKNHTELELGIYH